MGGDDALVDHGVEDGFVIGGLSGPVAVSGQYLGAFSPNNSIHHQSPGIVRFQISHALGEMFELESFQLGTFFGSSVPITVSGFLGGSLVGSDTLNPTPNTYVSTKAPSLQNVMVDRLEFNLGFAIIGPAHIDDIVLETSVIPEPTMVVVACLGLFAVLSCRRRAS